MSRLMTSRQWKHNKDNSEGIKKSLPSTLQSDPNARLITFKITTDDVDRDFDRVEQQGIRLDAYLTNPVVLWEHDTSQPIGKCVEIKKVGNSLVATVEFIPADNPFVGCLADGIYQLCKTGFLSATSIGFRPITAELTTDEARGAGTYDPGVDFAEIDLFEFSIVGVPANPNALIIPALTMRQELSDPVASVPEPEAVEDPSKSITALNTIITTATRIHRSRRIRLLD